MRRSIELDPITLDHTAPDGPMDTANAHRVMRQHLACTINSCARKKAAYWTLVEARHFERDSGRLGWGL